MSSPFRWGYRVTTDKLRNCILNPWQHGFGTPVLASQQRDGHGVPVRYAGAVDTFMTQEGPISLPAEMGEIYNTTFLPTVNVLNALPDCDSRMLPLSDRYYKRAQ